MLHRRTCPGCGKVLTLRTEDLGAAVVCGACGRRFEAPRGMDLVGGKGGLPAGAGAAPQKGVGEGKSPGNRGGGAPGPGGRGPPANQVVTYNAPPPPRGPGGGAA